MLASLATARAAEQDGATPAVEAKPAGAVASVPVPAAGATVAPPQKGEQSPPTPALTAAEPITPTDVAVKEEEVLIFSCRCCGNQYASTDGVRKHARKAHAKWLKAKDQDTTDRIASGERLCRSDAYCAQRRVPRSEAEALMAERERPVGRPAKAARDGETCEPDVVPDGFYCVGDAENPRAAFQKAVIDAVREVTHIAPPDANGRIIGEPITQEGVIEYPLDQLMLCASLTGAKYTTTTEVYPDSPNATDEECNDAQVAAVAGGLRYVVKNEGLS